MANTRSIDLEASSSQYLSAADSASLSVTGDFTLEGWVKFESLPADGNDMVFISKWNAGANKRSYYFGVRNTGGNYTLILIISDDGSNNNVESVSWTPSTGVWYHVAAVYDNAGTVDFYVDGAQQGTQQATAILSIHDNDSTFALGAVGTGSTFFDGKLDDWRLWSVKRTITEINDNKGTEIDSQASLNGSWHFNLGSVLTDSSGNSNTLTNNNTATSSTDIAFGGLIDVSDTTTVTDAISAGFSKSVSETVTITDDTDADYGWGSVDKSDTPTWNTANKS